MMQWLTWLGEFLRDVGTVIGLALQPGADLRQIATIPHVGLVIFTVAALGGSSLLLGQSAILFLNRTTPRRFAVSLFLGGVLFAGWLVIWALAIWQFGRMLFDVEPDPLAVAQIVGLAGAPFLFGFLVLIPHLGRLIAPLLELWSLLLVVGEFVVISRVALLPAVVCVGAGWAVALTVRLLASRLMARLRPLMVGEANARQWFSDPREIMRRIGRH